MGWLQFTTHGIRLLFSSDNRQDFISLTCFFHLSSLTQSDQFNVMLHYDDAGWSYLGRKSWGRRVSSRREEFEQLNEGVIYFVRLSLMWSRSRTYRGEAAACFLISYFFFSAEMKKKKKTDYRWKNCPGFLFFFKWIQRKTMIMIIFFPLLLLKREKKIRSPI